MLEGSVEIEVSDGTRRTFHSGDILLAEGHRLRVYVPYGRDWYAYSMRRLRENPNIAGHVVSNLLSRS